jgi:hypothetical protein
LEETQGLKWLFNMFFKLFFFTFQLYPLKLVLHGYLRLAIQKH